MTHHLIAFETNASMDRVLDIVYFGIFPGCAMAQEFACVSNCIHMDWVVVAFDGSLDALEGATTSSCIPEGSTAILQSRDWRSLFAMSFAVWQLCNAERILLLQLHWT